MQMQNRIIEKLNLGFSPVHLEVINESHNHHVPPNSETHFKVVVVTDMFEGHRLLARHRAVNSALADELAGGVHALAMHTYTPSEWQAKGIAPLSPNCAGQNKMTAE